MLLSISMWLFFLNNFWKTKATLFRMQRNCFPVGLQGNNFIVTQINTLHISNAVCYFIAPFIMHVISFVTFFSTLKFLEIINFPRHAGFTCFYWCFEMKITGLQQPLWKRGQKNFGRLDSNTLDLTKVTTPKVAKLIYLCVSVAVNLEEPWAGVWHFDLSDIFHFTRWMEALNQKCKLFLRLLCDNSHCSGGHSGVCNALLDKPQLWCLFGGRRQ